MPDHPNRLAWRATLTYAGVGLAWIFGADWLLGLWLPEGAADHPRWSVVKELLFVALSTGLLVWIIRGGLRRVLQAETALRKQEERWRLAIEGVGDGMWDTDAVTGRSYFSPQWLRRLGYTAEDFQGSMREWLELVHPDDRPRVEQAVRQYFADGTENYRCEFRLRTRDGGYRWILSRGRGVEQDETGRVTRVIGTYTDITERKHTEAELVEAADRYRDLFEANPNPMWIYDSESFAILAVNDSAVEHYGYSREQFLAMSVFDLRPPDEAERLRARVIERGRDVQRAGLWRHRLADGSVIVVEVTSQPLRWEKRPARVVMIRDITKQEAARHETETSQQRFRAIFQSANDAIFIASASARVTDCNDSALELFRTTRDEIVDQRVVRFFPPLQPDGSRSVHSAIAVLREVKNRPCGPLEWTLRRPDGSCFDCEVTVSALRTDHDEGYVLVVRDLTERRRATQQLQLLHAALRAAPTGWVITDARGRIEWVNPAFTRLTGYPAHEVIGRTPQLLRSGHHSREFYVRMWETIERGDVWEGDLHNRRKDGTLYEEHMIIAPVRDGVGNITHYVAMKHDITVERHLEQQLSRAQRLESIGMLASGIAHDLNNVLTPILLCVEFLKVEFPGDHAAAKLNLIAQAAQRGAGIVRQVLTFARGVEGERTTLQPALVLKEIGQLARETLPRNIEVRIHGVREEGMLVEGDVTQLHQALLNLVVNARDAMPLGGELTLRCRDVVLDEMRARRNALAPGAYVELSVSDTGTGIPEEALEKIFDPFFSTKPRGKGTGLGLSTVYGIVRGHDGAIEVVSQWGAGSTFSLLLPAVNNPARSSEAAAGQPVQLEGRGRLMLVVDDEESIRGLVAHILRRRGFVIVEAADGVEGLARFRSRPGKWAGAITDMMMPRMDGMALSLELRAIDPELPIIGMSGMVDDPEATEAGSVKIDPVIVSTILPKPFREQELLTQLARALREA